MNTRTTENIIEWGDLKRKVFALADGQSWPTQSQARIIGRVMSRLRNSYRNDDFAGGKGADTLDFLRNGFHAPEFVHAAEFVPTTHKRRAMWSEEEGEADAGKLLGGDDSFMLDFAKRDVKPGLMLKIEYAFAARCESDVPTAYGSWIAGLISSLESEGYDLTVDIVCPSHGFCEGETRKSPNRAYDQTLTCIRVKRANEVSDFTEWSALFAPTGYRNIGFVAYGMSADMKHKRIVDSGGGIDCGEAWAVEYDKTTQTVRVRVNRQEQNAHRIIPTLNESARAAGLIP